MMFLDWNPEWETGIGKIDGQHRSLLEQVDGLMEAVHKQDADRLIPRLLPDLVSYVDTHFQDEEMAMAVSNYPGLATHRQIHQDLQTKVASIWDSYQQGSPVVTEAVLEFLVGWLIDHINVEDRAMAKHLIKWVKEHPAPELSGILDVQKSS